MESRFDVVDDSLIHSLLAAQFRHSGVGAIDRLQSSQKYSFGPRQSRGKIAFKNSLGFQVKIEDLDLKCCIRKDDSKNKTSGRRCQVLGQTRRRLPALPSTPTKSTQVMHAKT
jgi:hypothetical protein